MQSDPTAGIERPLTRAVRYRPTGLEWGALAIIAALGVLSLTIPFTGDQALFAYGARALRHGDLLYRDFWDLKQPGIYSFYLVGGTLFGFTAVGIHLFELLWQLAFCWILLATLHRRFTHRWVASLVPLLTVGLYYFTARARDLTQIEALVGLPLYVSIWFAVTADEGRRFRRLLASGVAAAVVVYFKHLYVLVPVVTWIAILVPTRWTRKAAPRPGRWRDLVPLTLGLVVPLALAFAPYLVAGLGGRLWWTYVEYTPKVTALDPRPVLRLGDAVARFVALALPLCLLALWELGRAWKRRVDGFELALTIWVFVGLGTLLVQLWWSYQFTLLLWPVGLLAVLAIDELAGAPVRVRSRTLGGVAITVIVVILSLGALQRAVPKFAAIASHGFGVTPSGRDAIDDDLEGGDDLYAEARAEDAWLRRQPAGDIYVIGNPVYLLLSGRTQAIPVNGWSPEQADATVWRWIRDDLHDRRPRFIFVEAGQEKLVAERSPRTWASVKRDYRVVRTTGAGTWWAPRGDAP